mgnify:CR=1 FL=1
MSTETTIKLSQRKSINLLFEMKDIVTLLSLVKNIKVNPQLRAEIAERLYQNHFGDLSVQDKRELRTELAYIIQNAC